MPSSYDSSLKQIFVTVLPTFFRKNLSLQLLQIQEQNLELQTTLKRTLDYVAKVQLLEPTTNQPQEILLHIEFQTRNHKHMHKRMLEYYALLYRKYDLP
ncbi:MAG: hypothetical protein RML72_10350, partial [Bacteroidia bacterium]|nr:hypothetical protein [Bacteroidia bacterium]